MPALSAQRPVEPVPSARRVGRAPHVPRQRLVAPIGRVEIQNHVLELLADGGSVLLRGPAGIGKSTVLDSLAHQRSDALVLRVAAAEVESGLPYLTLVDLFGKVLADHGVVLRGHLRAALDAALLRTATPATAQDELAVRLAVLELLRVLSSRHPVLFVIDDLPWVDEPSAGVLRFVARRLAGLPVQMIATARISGLEAVEHADLCPAPCHEITLPPLGADDVADLLRQRFGDRISRSAILRVHAACGGNPLFALELGRAIAERGEPITLDEPLPVPDRLRDLLTARVAALPDGTRAWLVVAAAAARPTRELLNRAGFGSVTDVRSALDAGVATVAADGALRFTHPLLREMVYADAEADDRLRAHELLAGAVDDPVERARHLALARPAPDETLAKTLAEAAVVASHRGAPAIAAELAQLAAERTVNAAAAVTRRLEAARFAEAAGMLGEATRLAGDALQTATDPATRVALRLLLIDLAGQDYSQAGPLLEAADVDAGDRADLGALVHLYKGRKAIYDGDAATAATEFHRCGELAEKCGDTQTFAASLAMYARFSGSASGENDALLDRAAELAASLPLTAELLQVRMMHAAAVVQRGDIATALRELEALRAEVERGGSVGNVANVLISVTTVSVRAGRYAEALSAGRTCLRLFADLEVTPGPGLIVGAMAELYGGDLAAAGRHASAAIDACLAASDEEWLKVAYAVRGQVLMLEGDPVGALEPMRRAYDIEVRRGQIDPGRVLWYADFVETLAAAGARAEGARVLGEVTAVAEDLKRDTAMLSLARAGAVLASMDGDPRAAAADLTAAIARWSDHPFPIEIARAHHVLGTVERRAHRRGAARDAFAEAARRYGELGAHPWRGAAEAELTKLNGPRGLGLSDTEARIVDLVRRGATNREIARATFLSVKAIEANLTRLYRRFGVRNREQLSHAVAEMSPSD
ncbi:MAG TPA: AAA family ATPase [Micromonosporaceae bacterium]|nr:AAA family ATPase [Micromonosporaceae bacterium]